MTENQGKRKSQMNDSETFLFIAIVTAAGTYKFSI